MSEHFLLLDTHQQQGSINTKEGQKFEDPSKDGRVQDPTNALLPLPGLVAVPGRFRKKNGPSTASPSVAQLFNCISAMFRNMTGVSRHLKL